MAYDNTVIGRKFDQKLEIIFRLIFRLIFGNCKMKGTTQKNEDFQINECFMFSFLLSIAISVVIITILNSAFKMFE